jgi:hypothetical protein
MAPRLQFPQMMAGLSASFHERGRFENTRPSGAINGETNMQDAVFILVTIGFFAAAMAYVWGCDRLK